MTTRRTFLTQVGQAGGFGATYVLMQSLGLLAIPAARASSVALPENSGKGKSVVILGAGIAGMVAAWELQKAGYRCTILEARQRAGGRNWTIRNGTRIEMTDGTTETCKFAEGHYFNAGPARLPSQHQTILGYCREFGVALEVEVNSSRSSLLQCDSLNGGKPVEQRQVMNDTRGHVSELLAKSLNKQALDEDLTKEDKERMLEFLRKYGDLSPDNFYKGSARSGYKTHPGAADQIGVPRDPLDMHALLNASLWEGMLFRGNVRHAGHHVSARRRHGPDCRSLRVPPRECHSLRDRRGADSQNAQRSAHRLSRSQNRRMPATSRPTVVSARCLSPFSRPSTPISLPTSKTLSTAPSMIPPTKSPGNHAVSGNRTTGSTAASRFQSKPSAWSGIPARNSFPKKACSSPAMAWKTTPRSANWISKESSPPRAKPSSTYTLAARKNSPILSTFPGATFPTISGSWITHFGQKQGLPGYARLTEPDGPIYMAGDHVTHLVGWQEGAALSAHRAVTKIDQAFGSKPSQPAMSASAVWA